jgi:glycosyltransferase involved in cell wall biosynthesis
MRVMLVAHRQPPDGIAGVERVVEGLARHLARRGDTVALVSRRPGDPDESPRALRELLPSGVVHYRLTGGERQHEDFLAHHERLERLFASAVFEFDPDVVHVHHLFRLSPRFIELAYRLRIPVVVSLHDFYFACALFQLRKRSGELCDGPDGGLECARTCFADRGRGEPVRSGVRTSYFRALLRLSERVVAPSRYMAEYFERFGVDPGRIRVVGNGIAVETLVRPESRPPPRQRPGLALLYLGTVVPHKGVHVLVEALRLARLDAASLVIAGHFADGGYTRSLEAAAAEVEGLDLQLKAGYEPSELPAMLDAADCVVVPSQWPEAFGLVAREALARGVPVVVARVGGLPEAVVEGENGFTFAHDRPDELAAVLRRLAGDSRLVERLSAEARRSPVSSLTEHAEATREVYLEAIEEAARRRRDPAVHDELRFLHDASIELGFAATG